MSSYTVIAAVSKVLQQLLWESITSDDVVRPIVGSESAIVFKNPTETARDQSNRLSLWLYQITENEFMKNQPPVRINGQFRGPPMALNLYYLLTPFASSGESDYLLLGKTLEVIYDNSIVILQDSVAGVAEELRIVFCRLSLEELTRIWEALREPYRLSVCYQVRVAHINSTQVNSNARVIDRTGLFGGVPVSQP